MMLFTEKNNASKLLSIVKPLARLKALVLFLLLALLFAACRDIYEPELSVHQRFTVVEGLITDEEGPHRIRLSRSNVFGDQTNPEAMRDARVLLTNSHNDTIPLQEASPGEYFTPQNFKGVPGETYVLNIETNNGTVYRSHPQEMRQPLQTDTIYGEFGSQLFYYKSQVSGDIIQDDVGGVNMFVDVSGMDAQPPLFRFSTSMVLQYSVMVSWNPPEYDFCWTRRRITDFVGQDLGRSSDSEVSERNRFAFFPLNTRAMRHLGYAINMGDTHISYEAPRHLIHSIYSLNEDAYAFHEARNEQLDDDNTIFDPVAPQLPGNVYNTADEGPDALGFFEVSSVRRITMNVRPREAVDKIVVELKDCMYDVPSAGCMFMAQPDWWIGGFNK